MIRVKRDADGSYEVTGHNIEDILQLLDMLEPPMFDIQIITEESSEINPENRFPFDFED